MGRVVSRVSACGALNLLDFPDGQPGGVCEYAETVLFGGSDEVNGAG